MKTLKELYMDIGADIAKKASERLPNSFHNVFATSRMIYYSCVYGNGILLDRMEKKLCEGKLPRSARKRLRAVIEEFRNEIKVCGYEKD